eukprot:5483278-Lingulodinium_polyedra.AAC.1
MAQGGPPLRKLGWKRCREVPELPCVHGSGHGMRQQSSGIGSRIPWVSKGRGRPRGPILRATSPRRRSHEEPR